MVESGEWRVDGEKRTIDNRRQTKARKENIMVKGNYGLRERRGKWIMDASTRHHGCLQLAGRQYPLSTQMIGDNDGPLEPPTATLSLGFFLHEETGDEDSGQDISSFYQFFSGYGPAGFDSSLERFGTRIFSRFDCAQKRLYRSFSQNTSSAFVFLNLLFKCLPLAGPKIGLSGVYNSACFKKENKISGCPEFSDA